MISAGDEEMFSEQIRAQIEFYYVTVLERLLFLPAIDADQYSEYSVIECAKKNASFNYASVTCEKFQLTNIKGNDCFSCMCCQRTSPTITVTFMGSMY